MSGARSLGLGRMVGVAIAAFAFTFALVVYAGFILSGVVGR